MSPSLIFSHRNLHDISFKTKFLIFHSIMMFILEIMTYIIHYDQCLLIIIALFLAKTQQYTCIYYQYSNHNAIVFLANTSFLKILCGKLVIYDFCVLNSLLSPSLLNSANIL